MEMTPDHLDQAVAGHADQAAQPGLHPQSPEEHLAGAGRTRSTTRAASTPSPTRSTRPASSGAPTRSRRTSPACSSRGTSSGRPQAYSGKVAMLTEDRETIAMALLRKGVTDINTEDPKLINRAVADLKQLYGICNIKVGDVQYQTIPEDHGLAQPGLVGRHASPATSTTCRPSSTASCCATGRRPRATCPSRTTASRSARPRRSRCSRTCS